MTAVQFITPEDTINPHFVYFSEIHFDELDPMQMLHNSRFAAHIERAITAYYTTQGGRWTTRVEDNPDQFHVVRELHLEYLSPFIGPGRMRIDVWVEKLGNSSCVYGFLCSSSDGSRAHARGKRAIIKLDPQSMKPAPWTDKFRQGHSAILRDFQAYA